MKLKNKNILVTGGAGFIGSHLVDDLAKEGLNKIVVIDNFFLGKESNLKEAKKKMKNIVVYREDASDYNALEYILKKDSIDVVFDLAVKPLPYSFVNPKGAFLTSVEIAQNLCLLQKKDLFKTLIHFSSSEAFGSLEYFPMDEKHPLNPTTPYSAGKAAADLLILSYINTFGIDASILRPFNNYGPRQNDTLYAAIIPITIKRFMKNKKPVLEWDGQQTRDFIYVKDTTRATIEAYKNQKSRGKVINIASGKETKMITILDKITEIMGGEVGKYIRKPRRGGDVRRHCADISLAKKILKFEPKISLEEGLRNTISWYRNVK